MKSRKIICSVLALSMSLSMATQVAAGFNFSLLSFYKKPVKKVSAVARFKNLVNSNKYFIFGAFTVLLGTGLAYLISKKPGKQDKPVITLVKPMKKVLTDQEIEQEKIKNGLTSEFKVAKKDLLDKLAKKEKLFISEIGNPNQFDPETHKSILEIAIENNDLENVKQITETHNGDNHVIIRNKDLLLAEKAKDSSIKARLDIVISMQNNSFRRLKKQEGDNESGLKAPEIGNNKFSWEIKAEKLENRKTSELASINRFSNHNKNIEKDRLAKENQFKIDKVSDDKERELRKKQVEDEFEAIKRDIFNYSGIKSYIKETYHNNIEEILNGDYKSFDKLTYLFKLKNLLIKDIKSSKDRCLEIERVYGSKDSCRNFLIDMSNKKLLFLTEAKKVVNKLDDEIVKISEVVKKERLEQERLDRESLEANRMKREAKKQEKKLEKKNKEELEKSKEDALSVLLKSENSAYEILWPNEKDRKKAKQLKYDGGRNLKPGEISIDENFLLFIDETFNKLSEDQKSDPIVKASVIVLKNFYSRVFYDNKLKEKEIKAKEEREKKEKKEREERKNKIREERSKIAFTEKAVNSVIDQLSSDFENVSKKITDRSVFSEDKKKLIKEDIAYNLLNIALKQEKSKRFLLQLQEREKLQGIEEKEKEERIGKKLIEWLPIIKKAEEELIQAKEKEKKALSREKGLAIEKECYIQYELNKKEELEQKK